MNENDVIEAISDIESSVSTLSIADSTEPSMNRNCLTDDYTHYESQAFSVQFAINPLASAAAPLLHLAIKLRTQFQKPDLENLYPALCHEIRTFEYRAHASDYPPQVILGGRYLLCALLDEIILNSSWGRKNGPSQSLLFTFQQETWGGERFFTILQRCSQNPTNYIDILELGYLCLSLGFKGKYNQPESSQRLDHLIDNLYKLIRRQRGDFPRALAINIPKSHQNAPPWRLVPIWSAFLLTIMILAAIFVPYYQHIHEVTEPLYSLLNNINDTLNASDSGNDKAE